MKRKYHDDEVLNWLKCDAENHGDAMIFYSPTGIGIMLYGLDEYRAAAVISPMCKRLVERGLVERNDRGHYRAVVK